MDNKIRILMLEDNAEDVELAEHKLREEGFSFILKCVETEGQFVGALKEFEPDIILVDYTLPSYDGMTALSIVREHCPETPFIFVSGTIGEEVAIQALKSGATDYVLKNRLSRLGPAIRRALAEKGERLKRLQTEKALKYSARYWEITFDAIDDAVCLLDLKGKILRCNRAMANFLQKPIKDIVGGTCWELVHGTSEPIQSCPIARMKDTRKRESMVMETGDKFLKVIVDPVLNEDGDIVHVVHIISDMTEMEQARQAIQMNELRFRDLYDNAPIAYLSIRTADQSIIACNHAASRLLGYDKVDLLNMKSLDLYADTPNGKLKAQKIFKDFVSGNSVQDVELEMKHQNGHSVWISLTVEPVKDQEGKIIEARSVAIDISKRKQLEAQFRQTEKLESIGALAGGIAHDFNNILSSIIGYTELGLDSFDDKKALSDDLQEVLKAGNRAKDLVKQILAFSRQDEQTLKPIQLRLIANESLKLLRSSLPTTIQISNNIQSNALIMADPTQIHQVMMNLCTNAAHAMQAEGGILEIGLTTVRIDSDFASRHLNIKTGPFLKLTVRDTGHGIAPDILNRIFDPFFTTKEKSVGTGLGLSVVHGIVKSLEGAVTVYSELGKGTEFNIYLPVIDIEIQEEQAVEPPLPTGTERILFVDDEQPLRILGKKLLESLGYHVEFRSNGIEALEFFRANPERFDLIITDMTMPNMTGDRLAEHLMNVRPDIPVILFTGFSAKMDEEKAKAMGIRAFVLKPIIKSDIAKIVRRVLDEAKGTDQE